MLERALRQSVLIEVKRKNALFTSSAVLINDSYLISAAHSVENICEGKVFFDDAYNGKSQNFIEFEKIFIHPEYNQKNSNFLNDIALIKLSSKAHFAKPIELGDSENKRFLRVGFGLRDENKKTIIIPNNFMKNCDRSFNLTDTNSVIGDSGGPVFDVSSTVKLIGIHSTLQGDDLTYSSYVPFYKNWIWDKISIDQKSCSMH